MRTGSCRIGTAAASPTAQGLPLDREVIFDSDSVERFVEVDLIRFDGQVSSVDHAA
jgi:hypothetical protein